MHSLLQGVWEEWDPPDMPSTPSPPEMALTGTSQCMQAWPPLGAAPPTPASTAADEEGGENGAETAQPMVCVHKGNRSVQPCSGHGAVDAAAQELMSLLGI